MTIAKQAGQKLDDTTLLKVVQTCGERETYAEFTDGEDLKTGLYWIHVKIDWEKKSLAEHKENLTLYMNSYGVAEVKFHREI